MSQPARQKQLILAKKLISSVDEDEKLALSKLMSDLLALRASTASPLAKARRAIRLTKDSGVVLPIVKRIGRELKRIGWEERSVKARFGLSGAGIALLLFGSQGAGIAALGGAVGVPLWIVLGAGATFAGVIVEEVSSSRAQKSDYTIIESERKDEG